jgi:hypothetical protein
MWVYAPKWVNAKEFSDLTSQIDIAPTLLGLLKMDYESTFFGRDVLNKGSDLPSRILIGNYQHLGLFDGRDLAILSPGKRMRKHLDALGRSEEVLAGHDDPLMMREIAYYQAASYDWKQGLLAWKEPARAGEVFAIKKNNGNKHAL